MLLLRLIVNAILVAIGSISSAAAAASSQDDLPPDFAGFGNKPCPDYRCTGGMVPVPKSRQKFTSTGCSAMGGGLVMMGGKNDGNNEKVYESCCHLWHACYQVCGVSKKVCDDSFKTCTAEVCGEDGECKQDASLASLMIGMGGCQRFDEAQYGACECVDKSKETAKREAAIRRFYKMNAPDQEAKAEGLAQKADSKGKLASLFRKLLAKYPAAIEKTEDAQQAMYRNIFKDAQKRNGDADGATIKVLEEEAEEEEVQEL